MTDSQSPENTSRRKLKGLVVNRQTQFKIAFASLCLILLPTLVISVALIADLGLEATRLSATAPQEMAQILLRRALAWCLVSVGAFIVFSSIAIFMSLKLTNHLIGPVQKLENQLQEYLKGNFEAKSELRKTDYLKNLAGQINELGDRLKSDKRASGD